MRNQSSRTKSLGARLGDVVLSILAVAGGISIILVIVGFTMNVSIMMFRTGSMDPTIPAGSIAVVREIPATDINKGDIITVDRGTGLLPVTHRVTQIDKSDEATGAVIFVMRGDANEYDDPDPYTATTVQRTMFHVPGVAPVIQQLQNPYVLGGLTLGATILVIWAFWPRNEGSQHIGQQTGATANAPVTLLEVGDPVKATPRATHVGPLSSVVVKQGAARRAYSETKDGALRD